MLLNAMTRWVVIAAVATVAITTSPAAAAAPPNRADVAARIDAYLRGRMPSLRTPGVSLVVVEGDRVTFSGGYGFADREAQTPMTEDTPLPIASTNKGMTALAIMQLVEQGLVDLDAPVVRYLSDFHMADARAASITMRQLLSHTSGIPGGWTNDLAQDDQALERKVASLASVALHRDPGSGYEYANDGYSVAGLLLQRVSGMPYEDYLATHVFAPLKMTRSTFDPALAAEWGLATGYTKWHGLVRPGPHALSRGLNPAGGLITTAGDVGHYLTALLNGGAFDDGAPIISEASLDQMWTPEPAAGAESYGLGWGESHLAGLRLLLHAGDLSGTETFGGSASQFVLVPERRIGVGVLTNLANLDKAEIAQDVLAIVLGDEPAPRPVPPDWRKNQFTPDPGVWTAYVGEYQTTNGPLRVYREDDRLLGFGADMAIEFVPQSDTQFVVLAVGALDEGLVEFTRQADGSVTLAFQGRPLGQKQ